MNINRFEICTNLSLSKYFEIEFSIYLL